MHPFEQALVEMLHEGEEPILSRFGGSHKLLEAVGDLGSSPLMPEFLRLALTALSGSSDADREILCEFACSCIEATKDGFAWSEAVELLDQARPLPNNGDERCFAYFLTIALDRLAEPVARGAALDGAMRWATQDRKRQLRLLSLLLDVSVDDDELFLVRAAKLMGIAYSHWREIELVNRLLEFTKIGGVADEAAFELGMAKLSDALDAQTRKAAADAFESAHHWFKQACNLREQRPDAGLYVHCLEALFKFSQTEGNSGWDIILSELSGKIFEIYNWHSDSSAPPWLGSRYAEGACWQMLAMNLRELSKYLDEVAWYEPSIIIKDYLMGCYTASRSILKRSQLGGIEALVRPRIKGNIAHNEAQAHLLKVWLRRNSGHEWEDEARGLLKDVDSLIAEIHANPPDAAALRSPVAALIARTKLPAEAKASALAAISSAQAVHFDNLSDAEWAIIDSCIRSVADCSDYKNNPIGQCLFNAVLVWTIRFLVNRLEMTRKDDRRIGYLFESNDGKLPHESDLQHDYHCFMFSILAGTEIEVYNVGGGRADVRFTYHGERLIVEVKREMTDCSFEALERAYSTQATDYQNVSIRLGFLLVLDLVERRTGGTAHISSLLKSGVVTRRDESEPRRLITVKVPGRRFSPSDTTKQAKKSVSIKSKN